MGNQSSIRRTLLSICASLCHLYSFVNHEYLPAINNELTAYAHQQSLSQSHWRKFHQGASGPHYSDPSCRLINGLLQLSFNRHQLPRLIMRLFTHALFLSLRTILVPEMTKFMRSLPDWGSSRYSAYIRCSSQFNIQVSISTATARST